MNRKKRASRRRAAKKEIKRSQDNKADIPNNAGLLSSERESEWRIFSPSTIGVVLGILALLLGLLGVEARPTVSIGTPLDPSNVFSTPLIISNDGQLDLDKASIISFEIKSHSAWREVATQNISVTYVGTIGAGQKLTFPLRQSVKFEVLKDADFALILKFRPDYMPWWTKRVAFRFLTIQDARGNLRFQQQPPENALGLYYDTVKEILSNPENPVEGRKAIEDTY